MKQYAGIDVSLKDSHVCIVDDEGRVVNEAVVASEPAALAGHLARWRARLVHVGLEAGPQSQWLYAGLKKAGLPALCIETRHLKATLSALRVKTDRNDARAIAQVMRVGMYRAVHVKSKAAQEQQALLTARKLLVNKLKDIENGLRGLLRGFGLKLGRVGRAGYEARVRELVAGEALLAAIAGPLLAARVALREQLALLHGQVLQAAKEDDVCRRLMTTPGVGAVVALSFRSAVDDPDRFDHSRAVGAHFGLTPTKYQSGEIDRTGRISKAGDEMVRTALYEAASVLLGRVARPSHLKAWAGRVAQRRGFKRARVALARKLAIVLHRMWQDGTTFNWDNQETRAA
jgi:transposase